MVFKKLQTVKLDQGFSFLANNKPKVWIDFLILTPDKLIFQQYIKLIWF